MARFPELFAIDELISQLNGNHGRLVLVPNRRLVAKIQSAWRTYNASLSCVVPSLRVFAVSDYLLQQHLRLLSTGRLPPIDVLNPAQEIQLWKQCLQQSREDLPLLTLKSTAKVCMAANDLLNQWLIEDFHTENDNHQYFQTWQQRFNALCRLKNVQSISQMERSVILHQEFQALDYQALFFGFDSLPPVYDALLNALSGVRGELKAKVERQTLLRFNDAEQELDGVIKDIAEYIKQFPSHRVALVDPSLSQRRNVVEQALQRQFYPDHINTYKPLEVLPINISAGTSLLDAPIIQNNLLFLNVIRKEITMEDLHSLCFSPFIGGADEEFLARQKLYDAFRDNCRPIQRMAHVRQKSQELCPVLYSQLETINQIFVGQSLDYGVHCINFWLETLDIISNQMGWPGQRETLSVEYQHIDHWYSVKSNLIELASICGDLSLNDFEQLLRETLQETVFQAKVEDSQLQVLGALEAANLHFDAMWVMGMDDGQFPARSQPNPMLPLDLQVQQGMPHSSALRELHFAERLLASWRASAHQITFSFSRFDGEIKKRVSPLLRDLTIADVLNTTDTIASDLAGFETFEESFGPAVIDVKAVKGGSGILTAQSECPFKAFASYRLGMKQRDPISNAMSASDRGTAIHKALEILLPAGTNKDQIVRLMDAEMYKVIEEAAEVACQFLYKKRPDIMTTAYFEIEKQRIIKVLKHFVSVESERENFTISGVEQRIDTEFKGLPLHLRVDRIDQIDDHFVVLDYKTSADINIAGWKSDRPTDPQLILYCLLFAEHDVDAIAKIAVNQDEPKYMGLAGFDSQIKGIEQIKNDDVDDAWFALKDRWRHQLEAIMDEFAQGYAALTPSNSVCQYCHLKDMCRVGDLD